MLLTQGGRVEGRLVNKSSGGVSHPDRGLQNAQGQGAAEQHVTVMLNVVRVRVHAVHACLVRAACR